MAHESQRPFDPEACLQVADDPIAQWLDWEEQANLVGFRTSTRPVAVDVVSVLREELEIHILPGAPAPIVDLFLQGDRVLFPRHPLNRDPSVAWFDAEVSQRWVARFTSSRTLAFPGPESGGALFSLKLSTDRPHPDLHQPEKTRLREEAIGAVDWVRVLARIDALLGPLPRPALVTEILVVLAAGRESGFMVRDLRLFQDGHYYLPALSLPFVGPPIAARHGEALGSFWARHFARPVGRAKAALLARYGLWYETPNPQNVLLQLDRQLRPTGQLVFRDVGDGECCNDAFTAVDVPWTRLESDIRPETENSFWAFGEAGEHSLPRETLARWYAQHDNAYYAELARWFSELAPAGDLAPEGRLDHWNTVLRSDRGVTAVAAAFARAQCLTRESQADVLPRTP